jgi:DnaK suppressor protein
MATAAARLSRRPGRLAPALFNGYGVAGGAAEMPNDDFTSLLQQERTRLLHQIAELQQSFDDVVEASESMALDDEHDPDGSTVAFERAQVAALLGQAKRQLAALDDADQRLIDGTYGQCERCGGQIAPERLRAVPLATTCINC